MKKQNENFDLEARRENLNAVILELEIAMADLAAATNRVQAALDTFRMEMKKGLNE